jgi:hypothetical protein
MWMTGMRQAALMLEGDPEFKSIGVEYLATADLSAEEEALWGDGQNAYAFHQFVQALEQHQQLEELRFDSYRFCWADPTELDDGDDDDDDENEEEGGPWDFPLEVVRLCGADVERLFSSVLPNHLSIGTLQFSGCRIHPRHLTSLLAGLRSPAAEQLAASSSSSAQPRQGGRTLASLDFSSTDLGIEGWEIVAAGIRDGAQLERIRVDYGGLAHGACRLLCSAVASNPFVQELFVREQDANVVLDAECLGPILAGPATTSSIRTLTVGSDHGWTDIAATDWLHLLRTCVRLESLTAAVPMSPAQFETLVEALRTYNFTLQHVGLGRQADPGRQQAVDRIVRRNERIRLDYERAIEHAERLKARRLFPEAIALLNEFPTLVRRFLRQNADAFGAVVEAKADRAAGESVV